MPAPDQRVAGATVQKPSFVKHSIASQRLHQPQSPVPSPDRPAADRAGVRDAGGRSRSPPEQRHLGASALEGIAEGASLWQRRSITPRATGTTTTYRAPSTTLGHERPDLPAVRAAAMRSAMDAASGAGRGAGMVETRATSEELNEDEVVELLRRQREQQMALLQASSIEPGWTRRGHRRGRCDHAAPTLSSEISLLESTCIHPGVKLRANRKSISHRCHLVEVALVWELTKTPSIGPWVASRVVY